jgi:hypothetical protein
LYANLCQRFPPPNLPSGLSMIADFSCICLTFSGHPVLIHVDLMEFIPSLS